MHEEEMTNGGPSSKRMDMREKRTIGHAKVIDDLMQIEDIRVRLDLINERINDFVDRTMGSPIELYSTAYHLIKAGGKRLRSLLFVLSSEAAGGTIEKALPFALAIELTQTASLIHDDIMDEDEVRRGTEVTHKKFGKKMALIAGDLLIAQAVHLAGQNASSKMIEMLAEEAISMCEGQAQDLMIKLDLVDSVRIDTYIDMIGKKTAAFFKAAGRMGVTLAEASSEIETAIVNYCENIGYAFQIRDDILNIVSSEKTTGKSSKSDIIAGRCNYVLLLTSESLNETDRNEYLQAVQQANIHEALQFVEQTDAIRQAGNMVEEYVDAAKRALSGHSSIQKELLFILADFMLTRIH